MGLRNFGGASIDPKRIFLKTCGQVWGFGILIVGMTEKKYDSKFHRWYVGETGGEIDGEFIKIGEFQKVKKYTIRELLEDYRWYMRDKNAELPQEWVDELLRLGVTWD